jgi:hypothetical protein
MSNSVAFWISGITFAGLGWWGCFAAAVAFALIFELAELVKP